MVLLLWKDEVLSGLGKEGLMPKPIPISAAKKIAESYGYDQVIVFGRKVGDDGLEHLTTYGKTKEHCGIAAKTGDFLKHKIMGWPKNDL